MAKSLYTAQAHVVGGRDQGHGVTRTGRWTSSSARRSRWAATVGARTPSSSSPWVTPHASRVHWAWSGDASTLELGAVAIDSEVSLITTENRGFTVAVGLDVSLPGVDDAAQAISIVAAAHEVCPYSNATRGNIEVTLKANGNPVPSAEPAVR